MNDLTLNNSSNKPYYLKFILMCAEKSAKTAARAAGRLPMLIEKDPGLRPKPRVFWTAIAA